MARSRQKKKAPAPAPYWSETLATSRKMIAPGPLHEEQAVIYDLTRRAQHLSHTLPYYDRTTGKPIAEQAGRLREEAARRIEALPDEGLRRILTRELWK